MKNLITTATILSVLAMILFVAIYLIIGPASVPFTNDMAIDQLNGGDAAYVAMQTWYDFRNIVTYIGYAVTATAFTLIIIIIYKILKERKK